MQSGLIICVFSIFAALSANAQEKQTLASETDQRKISLEAFIAKKKFVAEGLYTGVPNLVVREKCERLVNDLAKRLLARNDVPLSQQAVMTDFRRTLNEFELADIEDRERIAAYLEELMDILGIRSSDGLLNKWMYGFDPTQSAENRNEEALAAMTAEEREIAKKVESLPPTEVIPFLTQMFGKPSLDSESATMWMDAKNPVRAIGVTNQSGKKVLVWTSMGRFTYTRKL